MSRFSVFATRIRALFLRQRLERELDDELRFHLEMQAEDNVRAGMDPAEAEHAARRSFGGLDTTKETYRERRALPLVETVAQDLRYALRMMRKSPGFTAVAVFSLAIGIGANTAVFSFADALLLRPLTVPRASDILTVGSTNGFSGSLVASHPEFVDLRNRNRSFEDLVAFTSARAAFAPQPDSVPKVRIGMLVSGNFFTALGVKPQLGRAFRPEEDQVPGRDAVVILGHDFWTQQFGADASILGRRIRLSGIEFTIIGVAPVEFTGLDQFTRFEFYVPLMMWPRLMADPNRNPLEARDFRSLTIKGRLKSGVTMTQAQAELSIIARDLDRAYPETARNRNLSLRTELQSRIAQAPPLLNLVAMLTTLAGAVLLVACGNVAGLLTSRAPTRARELALRLAIGAGRLRVVRQLITESLLIAVSGGAVGLGIGYAGVKMFRLFQLPTDLPVAPSFTLDRRALLVSVVVALSSVILFGLAPAIRATRTDLTSVMKATDTAGFGRRRWWGRALLVSGQVAVSVVLLAIATFMYRSFRDHLENGPGFRTDHVLTLNVDASLTRYTAAQARLFFDQLVERARLVPGVKSVALTSAVPMNGTSPVAVVPEGFQFPAGVESATVPGAIVDEGYFDTIGIAILRGRAFRATDSEESAKVAIVNDQFARRYWPGQDPLGKRFRLNDGKGPWVEVVGLAKTSKYFSLIDLPREFVYLPHRQTPTPAMTLLAESLGNPEDLVQPLREVVRGIDAGLPIFNVRTLEEVYRLRAVVIFQIVIGLIGVMGLMGLALAIVGLYGLMAYTTGRRTREIGIRMAIGANRFDVLRMVVRQGILLAAAGIGVGVLASVAVRRALSVLFPGGRSAGGIDVVPFLLVTIGVLAVTLLAAYVPARRASRVNPTEALRCD